MKNFRPWLPLLAFLVFLFLAALPLVEGRDPLQRASPLLGKPVPQFDLSSAIGGEGFSDEMLKGAKTPAVVNFFASWCATCRGEQPVLQKLADETGIPVFGVDYKDKPEAAKAWLARNGNPFKAVGADPEGRIAIEWGVYGVPETYIVDRQGIIRAKYVGPLSEAFYRAEVKPLLEKLK